MEQTDTLRFVCILCPRGCRLEVSGGDSPAPRVQGNACPRGEGYGLSELRDPRRTLTTTLRTEYPGRPRLPVKSSATLPRSQLVAAARALDQTLVRAPVRRGDVLVHNVLGLGVDMVATDDLP